MTIKINKSNYKIKYAIRFYGCGIFDAETHLCYQGNYHYESRFLPNKQRLELSQIKLHFMYIIDTEIITNRQRHISIFSDTVVNLIASKYSFITGNWISIVPNSFEPTLKNVLLVFKFPDRNFLNCEYAIIYNEH